LSRLYTALKAAPADAQAPDWEESSGRRFREAMDDDFNTPEAVAVLFDLASETNRRRSSKAAAQLRALGGLLGLLGRESDAFLRSGAAQNGISETEISKLIAEREEARAARDFRRADGIRAALLEKGVVLEDNPRGTTWRRV